MLPFRQRLCSLHFVSIVPNEIWKLGLRSTGIATAYMLQCVFQCHRIPVFLRISVFRPGPFRGVSESCEGRCNHHAFHGWGALLDRFEDVCCSNECGIEKLLLRLIAKILSWGMAVVSYFLDVLYGERKGAGCVNNTLEGRIRDDCLVECAWTGDIFHDGEVERGLGVAWECFF
jgi:hypothetical protein